MFQPRFALVDTPTSAIVVVFVDQPTIEDELACKRLRGQVTRCVADLPVVLRCDLGRAVALDGPEHLKHHAIASRVAAQPTFAFEPQEGSWWSTAA